LSILDFSTTPTIVSAQIVFAFLVKAGHSAQFRRRMSTQLFSAQGAGKAFDDVSENVRLEFTRAEVVEKESAVQRRALAMSLTQWFTSSAPIGSCLVHGEGDS